MRSLPCPPGACFQPRRTIRSSCGGHPFERRQPSHIAGKVLQADLDARPDDPDGAHDAATPRGLTKNVHRSKGGNNIMEDAQVIDAISDATQRLDRGGRLIVRPSGTEPVIRVTAEGDDPVLIELTVDRIVDALREAMQQ